MAGLIDIRAAVRRGDKDEARRMLKTFLRESPSAEGWYLAARVSNSKETAIKHLQRALIMDPNHIQAKRMLDKLGGKRLSGLRETLTMESRGGGERSSLGEYLRHMPPAHVYFALAVSVLLLICMTGVLILGAAPPDAPTVIVATPGTYALWSPEDIAAHFSLYSPFITVEETRGAVGGTPIQNLIVMRVDDGNGDRRMIQALFYGSEREAVNDMTRLAEEGWPYVAFNHNVAVIMPEDLGVEVSRQVVDALDAANDPQQVQQAITRATATATAPGES